MANWRAIRHAGLTLVDLLQHRVDSAGLTVTVQLATAQSFQQLAGSRTSTITVFLYRVTENAELRNAPRPRRADGSTTAAPMAVELCYLITPWGVRASDSAEADAAAAAEEAGLLGLIMQTLKARAELSRGELYEDPTRPDAVWGVTDTAQVIHETLSIEDQYRIWDASELPYRLSASYRMRVVGIDALDVERAPPVIDAERRFGS